MAARAFSLDYIHQASLRPSSLAHYFFLIKSTGSPTRAARILCVSVSAVSGIVAEGKPSLSRTNGIRVLLFCGAL
jgi:hypothetical protein